jgi:predicted aspartyl protease
MGIFRVDVEIASRGSGPDFHRAGPLIVDTGSEVTSINAEVLRMAGVEVRKPAQQFVMANGQTITRDVGYAIVAAEGFETIDEVMFALEGDLQLLGSRTIEGFNARVGPEGKRLVAAGPIVAAAAGEPQKRYS